MQHYWTVMRDLATQHRAFDHAEWQVMALEIHAHAGHIFDIGNKVKFASHNAISITTRTVTLPAGAQTRLPPAKIGGRWEVHERVASLEHWVAGECSQTVRSV